MLDIILWIPSIRPSSHDFVVVCHMWLLMVLYYAFMTIWLCVWIMFLFVIKQCMHISEPSESIKLLKYHLLKCSTLNCKGNTLAKFEFAQCPCSILCSPMRLSYATYFKSISTKKKIKERLTKKQIVFRWGDGGNIWNLYTVYFGWHNPWCPWFVNEWQ